MRNAFYGNARTLPIIYRQKRDALETEIEIEINNNKNSRQTAIGIKNSNSIHIDR